MNELFDLVVKDATMRKVWLDGELNGYRRANDICEMRIKEMIEWLKKYSVHGGRENLTHVLEDMATHSKYGRYFKATKPKDGKVQEE